MSPTQPTCRFVSSRAWSCENPRQTRHGRASLAELIEELQRQHLLHTHSYFLRHALANNVFE